MAKITGTVEKDGAPLERAYVRCVGPSGEFVAEEYTGPDGAFVFNVVDGGWTLEVRAAGIDTHTHKVDVADDGDVDVPITVG
jgi:hypothetical protein